VVQPASSIPPLPTHWSRWAPPVLVGSVLTVATAVTWIYLTMRAVMDIGGSCASGGPYVIANPCPNGVGLMALAVPLMLVATFAGSAAASSLKAPALILPMWAALFGSLGWNFLDYGIAGEALVAGWLVCGVMFWLMAAPAVALVLGGVRRLVAIGDQNGLTWVGVYVVATAIGVGLSWWAFTSS
jgi:hypothetical protein